MNRRTWHSKGPLRRPSGRLASTHRRGAGAAALAATLFVLLVLFAPAADAAGSHLPSINFGAPGAGAGRLALGPDSGVAVNSSTHDIYVADTGNRRIDEFDSSGAFIRAFGWGVADGGAELQSCALVCQAGISGRGAGQFETPVYVAVDNDPTSASVGDVYVADTADRLLTKFDAAGNLVAGWGDHRNGAEEAEPDGQLEGRLTPGGPFLNEFESSLSGIAVDTLGDLWAYTSNGRMLEFDQAAGFLQEWGGPGARPAGIALDAGQDIYLDSGSEQIEKLTSSGASIVALTREPTAENGVAPPTGLAVDQRRGDTYVDSGRSVAHISRSCGPASCPTEETFGAPQLRAGAGVGVDSSSATVYVADAGADVLYAFSQALEVDTGPSAAVTAATATVSGSVDAEGSTLRSCEFEYGEGEGEEYVHTVPCSGAPEPSGPAAVEAELTGLRGGTTYHYRLAASNLTGGTVYGEGESFTTLATAIIAAPTAKNLTGTAADLGATVNPVGLAVSSCAFDYGPSATYGLSVPCEQSPGSIGAGNSPAPVGAHLDGLLTGITYHWRLVVNDADGSAASADQTFVVGPGAEALPDGRQYEMVTPVAKNGALIGKLFSFIPPQTSADGSRLFAATVQCFPGAPSCVGARQNEGAPYEFARTAQGWVTRPLAPSATVLSTYSYWSFSPGAGTVLYSVPDAPSGADVFYARMPDGSFTPIGPVGEGPGARSGNFENVAKEGLLSTADLSHLVFETAFPAWGFDPTMASRGSLYEYVGTGNPQPLLVGVKGGGGSTDLISRCGTTLGNRINSFAKLNRPLSEDGRTVYFTAERCEPGANEGVEIPALELYARIDGESADAHTVLISGPTPASCTSSGCEENTSPANQGERARDASFEGAAADGSSVFFTSTQQLVDGATQDPAKGDNAPECTATTNEASGCNLYESLCPSRCADPSRRRLIDLSATITGGPRVQSVLAISPDGSHAYFVAKGLLTDAANGQGQRAHNGAENLYVYQRDAAFPEGHVAFIAVVSPADAARAGTANVTPDGDRLVFLSNRALTADATRPQGPAQVYEYDDEAGTLTRISIGQGGFDDDGNAGVGNAGLVTPFSVDTATSVPERSDPTMSDDGSFIFFQSPIALTPHALDDVEVGSLGGEPLYAQNVYEFHDGTVSLISDGKDVSIGAGFPPQGVELLGADRAGENVFFSTADPLVAMDTDTQIDIYDAHVCSGAAPCLAAETQPPSPCEAEACRGATATAPLPGTPASSTFSGPGNPKPVRHRKQKNKKKSRARCPKAKKTAHGRCVKQTRRKRADSDRGAKR